MAQLEYRGKDKAGQDVWMVRVFLGYGADGKKLLHNKTIHGSRKKAERYAREKEHERDAGTFIEPSKQQLKEYLEQWLTEISANRVSRRTLSDYRYQLNKYVCPIYGNVRLDQIQTMTLELQRLINSIASVVKPDGTRTVRTAQAVYVVLKQALGYAKKTDLIARNPMEHVERPRTPKSESTVLTREQVNALLATARDHSLYALIKLMVITGLRPSEALGLLWEDIDLDKGVIHVQRALDRHGQSWTLKDPKTRKSRRSIPLTKDCVRTLREHRRQQAEMRLSMGNAYDDYDLVFATKHGHPLERHNVTKQFKRILTQAGLPLGVRLYDLRHTCATLLLLEKINPKVVSERLGHSSITITLDCYSHVLPDMQVEATQVWESILE